VLTTYSLDARREAHARAGALADPTFAETAAGEHWPTMAVLVARRGPRVEFAALRGSGDAEKWRVMETHASRKLEGSPW
jgi:hypothetical protein